MGERKGEREREEKIGVEGVRGKGWCRGGEAGAGGGAGTRTEGERKGGKMKRVGGREAVKIFRVLKQPHSISMPGNEKQQKYK